MRQTRPVGSPPRKIVLGLTWPNPFALNGFGPVRIGSLVLPAVATATPAARVSTTRAAISRFMTQSIERLTGGASSRESVGPFAVAHARVVAPPVAPEYATVRSG